MTEQNTKRVTDMYFQFLSNFSFIYCYNYYYYYYFVFYFFINPNFRLVFTYPRGCYDNDRHATFNLVRVQWNPAIRPPRYCDHFFVARTKAHSFSYLKTPLIRPPRYYDQRPPLGVLSRYFLYKIIPLISEVTNYSLILARNFCVNFTLRAEATFYINSTHDISKLSQISLA